MIIIKVNFTNVIAGNDPNKVNGSTGGSSGGGSELGWSSPNASQTNWDEMQQYIKEWGTPQH